MNALFSDSTNQRTDSYEDEMNQSAGVIMERPTIMVENLSKRFNNEWIFRNLTYHFASPVYAVTGPNGSGKSTLLQVLWGQVPQSAGSITYKDAHQEIPLEEISQRVSIATPYMDLIDEFTLLEQLNFHFKLRKIRTSITMDHLLEIMYLQQAKDKFIGNFSSGMKQRVKLALALYSESEFIFLDEPGTNLDEQAFEWYKNELLKIPAATMIFIATNNPKEYPENSRLLNLLDYKKLS